MTRILVADDNSNIQRMVTLALQGEGIEVVAVGNGEAAVRKLPDGPFDLVLADIFMPVRSGYEVCEFIKHDSRYSHIPVVLLVGAFDPLDEVEAQRVSADGILKKPFVPPDPLIGMVKGLLAKSANERPATVAEPVGVSASSARKLSDSHAKEFPALDGEAGNKANGAPTALSPLLEMPTTDDADVDDADLVLTSHRDPSLGEPSWNHPLEMSVGSPIDTEDAPPDNGIQDHTWNNPAPLGASEHLPAIESAAIEIPVMETPPMEKTTVENPAVEDMVVQEIESTQYEEIPRLELAGSDPVEAPALPYPEIELSLTESRPEDARGQSDVSPQQGLEPAPDPELETPLEWGTEKLAQGSPLESTRVSWGEITAEDITANKPVTDNVANHNEPGPNGPGSVVEPEVTVSHAADSGLPDARPHQNGSPTEPIPSWLAPVKPFFPGSKSMWATTPEALADTQELAPGPGQVEPTTAWPPPFEPAISIPSRGSLESTAPVGQSVHVSSEPAAESPLVSGLESASSAPAVVVPPAPDAALIDAIVARVVERMQPKVFDVVTREILRPLVEAMVRREVDRSK